MNIQEYQTIIQKTAIYPKEVGAMYCALGLNGEAGEVAEKIKKLIRDTNYLDSKDYTDEFKENLKKEIGDCIWYCTALANEFNLSLEEILEANYNKLIKRRETNTLQGSGDNREEKINKLFFWKKKVGDIHIAGKNTTLCGIPMLGNNYATQKEYFCTCFKCTEVMEQEDNKRRNI
jgi:NTP pyrophosphatase (non-canonical NTP hydrolase)